jgi:hypothetical protein
VELEARTATVPDSAIANARAFLSTVLPAEESNLST